MSNKIDLTTSISIRDLYEEMTCDQLFDLINMFELDLSDIFNILEGSGDDIYDMIEEYGGLSTILEEKSDELTEKILALIDSDPEPFAKEVCQDGLRDFLEETIIVKEEETMKTMMDLIVQTCDSNGVSLSEFIHTFFENNKLANQAKSDWS